jgi:WD40 repeat protein
VILLIANANGNLFEYNANDGKELFHLKEEGNQIMAIDYHPEATAFCTGGKDNIIRVYDDHTRQVVIRLEGFKWLKTGHNNRLFAVKYKQDQPSLIASGGWDQNVIYL